MSNTSTMMALAGIAALGWFGYKYVVTDNKPDPREKARQIAQQNLDRTKAAQPKRTSQAPVVSVTKPLTSKPAPATDAASKAAEAREKYRNLSNRSSGVPSP